MGADKHKKRQNKEPRHVRLYHWMTDSPAWHDLDAVSRAIYLELAKRYAGPGSNNGRIPYSVREAASELGIHKATASRSLQSLVDHGFVVCTRKGHFDLKTRHATEWQLTEFHCDITHAIPSKEFMRWVPQEKNPGSLAQLTGLVAQPNGSRSATVDKKEALTVPVTQPSEPESKGHGCTRATPLVYQGVKPSIPITTELTKSRVVQSEVRERARRERRSERTSALSSDVGIPDFLRRTK
jgi:hypothetical protein